MVTSTRGGNSIILNVDAYKTPTRNHRCRDCWFRRTEETTRCSNCRASPNVESGCHRWQPACAEEKTPDVGRGSRENCSGPTEEMGGIKTIGCSGFVRYAHP